MNIGFGVDKTTPKISVQTIESGETYAVDNKTVKMSISDNLKLKSVIVYLDGKEYKTWSETDISKLAEQGGTFEFDIPGNSTNAHNLKIVAVDSAGNESVVELNDFYVTTNLWVRFYTNKLLFFGSIAGLCILLGLVVLIIVWKKKNKEQ